MTLLGFAHTTTDLGLPTIDDIQKSVIIRQKTLILAKASRNNHLLQ
jgi:hypothetical protein